MIAAAWSRLLGIVRRARGTARLFVRRAVETARLCCGLPDYDVYVRHLRAHHPDRPVPTYAAFFRERQTARYGGMGGRCC